MDKLSVVIPVYNEEDTIREILEKVFSIDMDKEVLVVDDCSTDSTRTILEGITNPGLKVILKDRNEGKGSAVRLGIDSASGDYIIIQDADLEYYPEDYPALLEPLVGKESDAVYGDRFPLGSSNMFLKQKLANRSLTLLTNLLYGGKIGDMETCYKVMPSELFKSLDLQEENFDIEAEISAKLLKLKKRVVNIPIRYRGRSYTEGKKIGFRDAVSAVKVLLKYRFWIK